MPLARGENPEELLLLPVVAELFWKLASSELCSWEGLILVAESQDGQRVTN